MELYAEFRKLIEAFNAQDIPYAVCGGVALALYGHVRATQDVDVLIPEDALDQVRSVSRACGFQGESGWIPLAQGEARLFRMWKADPDRGDLIPLDLLMVSPPWQEAWDSRQVIKTDFGEVWVVSREALKQMKLGRANLQDKADIERLEEEEKNGC